MSFEATQRHDAYDRFTEICREFREYPKLQLQLQKPQEALYAAQQWKKLHERQEVLFDDEEAELSFWETGRLNKFPRQDIRPISDLDALHGHLNRGEKDPHVRHLGSTGVWGWQIRQAANYHSFDVGTGRSFWLTIKGNDLFKNRIRDTCHLLNIPSKTEVDEGDVSPYMKASLATHIVYLSWCDENWRSFINDLEAAVRKIVDPVNGALVDDHIDRNSGRANSWPRSLQGHPQFATISKNQTWSNTSDGSEDTPPMLSRMLDSTSLTLSSWLKREKNPDSDPEKGNHVSKPPQNLSSISSTLDPHGTLDRFSFRDLQSLHKHADVVQKTTLVLELNIGVLRDISDYYKYLAATEFQATPRIKDSIEEFLREVSAISRRLETRMKQLRSLEAYLNQSMALYDKVLQQRSNQISTINGCHGRNGYNDRVSFMPRIALDQFWSTERIENILRSPPERIQAMSHTIRSRYVVVFSILVFMSQPEHIPIFIQEAIEDSQLPLAGTPYVFSETPESGIFDEFHKHQWKFCPLEFDNGYKLSKRRISPYHVVPVLDKAPINPRAAADEDDVTIYKVTLHPSCFHQTVVVFKVFSGEDHDTEKMYDNEVDMYSQLVRESAFNHIIRYYGSFETAGLRTIVLEYANGGSLKSFFLNSPPPHSRGNCEQFWNSLMGLLRGLENIHNLNESKRYSKGAWVLRGTHQDIKPQNILLCNTSFENMYDITFKFVDMGTGNIRKMKNQGLDRDALDQAGNGMYSAPEACQDDGEARGIRGNSDVWSFGGIASEALVWSLNKTKTSIVGTSRRPKIIIEGPSNCSEHS
ncbi:Serine/threonine-protein kinase ksp1 [Colletotrichum siamense]|nr:Serine/threonine-protein kinase ksp1 [Colletotrichum siamense]